MAKFLPLITDTHLNNENGELVKDIFKQFIDLIKSNGLNKCAHIGDFFTSRSSQSLNCLLIANDILNMFEEENILMYIIPGNHDKTSLIDEKSYLSVVCQNRKFIKLIEKETIINFKEEKLKLFFLPYFKEGVEYLSRLNNLIDLDNDLNYKKILLTHTSINGVRNNDGSLVDGDIEQDFLEYFDLVLSGHYHNRSKVSKRIIYIGSAYQANFGEDYDKGFAILNSDLKLDFIQSRFPLYKKIIIDAEDKDKANKMLEKYGDSKDNIRFVFKGDQQQIDNIEANKFTQSGISVQFENIVDRGILFDDLEQAEFVSFEKKGVLKNYIKYAGQQEFNANQLKEGMEYLKEIKF